MTYDGCLLKDQLIIQAIIWEGVIIFNILHRGGGSNASVDPMPYQMFRVVDGKIIEEDEATFQEREKKVLEGILMPVSYTCLICKQTLCATTEAELYIHWKKFHCDENDEHTEGVNSEIEKTDDETLPEAQLIMEHGKAEDDPSSANLKPENENGEVDDGGYYPKEIFIVKVNVIHQDMGFGISPSLFPPERCCMHEIMSNPGKTVEESCDCVENRQNKPYLDFSACETDSLESEDWGPMPKLSPPCSPLYDKQIEEYNDDAEETAEQRNEPKKLVKKRKRFGLPDNGLPKRPRKEAKVQPTRRATLYDAMRRGERLWWCKLCDDYLNSLELLKYHIVKAHNEDMSKINRFNIATWDLEIARTFTSPHEIELEHELNSLVPTNPIEEVPS